MRMFYNARIVDDGREEGGRETFFFAPPSNTCFPSLSPEASRQKMGGGGGGGLESDAGWVGNFFARSLQPFWVGGRMENLPEFPRNRCFL